jgi:hypothetical protein
MLLFLVNMKIAANPVAFSSDPESDLRSTTPSNSTTNHDRDLDALARRLASDFPLHSMSELRRTLMAAEDDLWPHKDPIDVVDRARDRLRDGIAG